MKHVKSEFSGNIAHLQIFSDAIQQKDATVWNTWRAQHDVDSPNLRGADLREVVLHEVNLQFTDLTKASLKGAVLSGSFGHALFNDACLEDARIWSSRFEETQFIRAICSKCQFRGSRIVASNFSFAQLQQADFERCYLEDTCFDSANLTGATFYQADLWMAFLRRATIHRCNFRGANLHGANLTQATLTSCDLRRTVLVNSDIKATTIRDCNVYGVSAWDLATDEKTLQMNLQVSDTNEAPLYVDDLEVAQFIYLMVKNSKIRDVIDTISKKAVLILGRFTAERKVVLDALREKLREMEYVPIIFDFDKPTQKDFEETVKVLAGLSRFVIADITNPSSSPLEIHAIVPDYMTPLVPIIMVGEKPFSMFEGLQKKFFWVLDTVEYPSKEALIRNLEKYIVAPAVDMEKNINTARSLPRVPKRIPE